MSFQVGDFAVCPGHGVGQIFSIESRDMGQGNDKQEFYIIKLASNGMKIMIPVGSKEGIRKLANTEEIQAVFGLLNNHDVQVDNSTWNRRYRDYMEKIKTGSLMEIADVLRSLFLLKHKKTLSFGEKKMLNQCKELLVQEIALSIGDEKKCISDKIENCFQ